MSGLFTLLAFATPAMVSLLVFLQWRVARIDRKRDADFKSKLEEIHALVNSNLSKARTEIADLKAEIASIKSGLN